jgi:hypothetical protein
MNAAVLDGRPRGGSKRLEINKQFFAQKKLTGSSRLSDIKKAGGLLKKISRNVMPEASVH